jgi:hypothetical protein
MDRPELTHGGTSPKTMTTGSPPDYTRRFAIWFSRLQRVLAWKSGNPWPGRVNAWRQVRGFSLVAVEGKQ